MEPKVLRLNLKAQWYNMIESGIKTEEYREIKPYWEKRLCDIKEVDDETVAVIKIFDIVEFVYGYTKRKMRFKCLRVTAGRGKKEWGAPDKDCFIIKLGNKID